MHVMTFTASRRMTPAEVARAMADNCKSYIHDLLDIGVSRDELVEAGRVYALRHREARALESAERAMQPPVA